MEYITLSNGIKMPQLGYGVYQVTRDECERCVLDALETGYRLIDTAQAYYNEKEVGDGIQRGIQELGIRREDIFLTTKVWVTEFGYEKTKASVEESLRKLQTDYLDLVLIHQCLSDYYGACTADFTASAALSSSINQVPKASTGISTPFSSFFISQNISYFSVHTSLARLNTAQAFGHPA